MFATRQHLIGLLILSIAFLDLSMDLLVLFLGMPAIVTRPRSFGHLAFTDRRHLQLDGRRLSRHPLGDRFGRRKVLAERWLLAAAFPTAVRHSKPPSNRSDQQKKGCRRRAARLEKNDLVSNHDSGAR
ncbi:hypothetical protein [Agrobacterium sp. RAC06]|uniref:hypothetical protein n=1 Tax=Agrobacterium sp. RAC06 TaxID=1842536 RepID=UPI001AECF78B|nr:hypothetical protein [Agrobacterium sp. RAC06]